MDKKPSATTQPLSLKVLLEMGLNSPLLGWLSLLLTMAAWFAAGEFSSIVGGNAGFLFLFIVSLPCALWWLLRWRRIGWRAVLTQLQHNYGFHWYRRTLGACIVLASAAYLMVSLLSLPVRRDADARVDNYIRKGEVAASLERTGVPYASNSPSRKPNGSGAGR